MSNVEEVANLGNETMEIHSRIQPLLNVLNTREQRDLKLPWIDNSLKPLMQWDYIYRDTITRIQDTLIKFMSNYGF